jgi:hypothetical protein
MYGKSEDDLEVEEQRELKSLMKGEGAQLKAYSTNRPH